jgi:hypothetical protein
MDSNNPWKQAVASTSSASQSRSIRSHSPRGFGHLTDGPRPANVKDPEETPVRLKIMNVYVKRPSL